MPIFCVAWNITFLEQNILQCCPLQFWMGLNFEIKELRIPLSKYRASGNTLRQYCSNITAIHSGNIVAILDFVCKLVSHNNAVMILSGNIVAILPKLLQKDTWFAKTLCLSVRPSLYVYIYNIFFLSSKSNFFFVCHKIKITDWICWDVPTWLWLFLLDWFLAPGFHLFTTIVIHS